MKHLERGIFWLSIATLVAMTACGGGSDDDNSEGVTPLPGEAMGDGNESPEPEDQTPDRENPDPDPEPEPEPDPEPEPEPEPEPDPEPMHSGSCTQTQFTAVEERAFYEDFGAGYIGIDGPLDQPYGLLFIQVKVEEGASAEPGIYDLENSTDLATCKHCVYSFDQCNPQSRQCARVYVASEGALEIYETGNVDEPFRGRLINAKMKLATVNRMNGSTTFTEGGDSWCAHDYNFDVVLDARPADIGDTVRDFELQSCATGEMVSVKSLADQTNALWFVAAAGWCSACRQHIPNVLQNAANIPADRMSPIFIVGENGQYARPTVEFCRQYASTYGIDNPVNWFIDHDGVGSFATTFSKMRPYTGPNGEFGLPWNAVVRGSDFTYYYADGSGMGDLGQALNALIGGE